MNHSQQDLFPTFQVPWLSSSEWAWENCSPVWPGQIDLQREAYRTNMEKLWCIKRPCGEFGLINIDMDSGHHQLCLCNSLVPRKIWSCWGWFWFYQEDFWRDAKTLKSHQRMILGLKSLPRSNCLLLSCLIFVNFGTPPYYSGLWKVHQKVLVR